MGEFVRRNVPKTFRELLVYWVWVHSILVAKFTKWRKPYKSGYLSLDEVARGYYVGYKASLTYGAGYWAAMGSAMAGLILIFAQ